jgi:hypothetical protein
MKILSSRLKISVKITQATQPLLQLGIILKINNRFLCLAIALDQYTTYHLSEVVIKGGSQ